MLGENSKLVPWIQLTVYNDDPLLPVHRYPGTASIQKAGTDRFDVTLRTVSQE